MRHTESIADLNEQEMINFAFLCSFDVLGKRANGDQNAKVCCDTARRDAPAAYRLAVQRFASLHPQSDSVH